jgi:AcrR family transcriptional regulator
MPDDTPGRLVAAATQLIADGGEEATSLRAVSRAARSNAAAVHYHFGGRDQLLAAVVADLLEPVQHHRLDLLDSLRRPAPVVSVVEALVRPDLELLAELGPDRARVAQLLGRPAEPGTAVAALLERQFAELAARAVALLDVGVPADELLRRLRWVRAVVASILATAPETDDGSEDTVDGQVAGLVGFCAAGLAAQSTKAMPRRAATSTKATSTKATSTKAQAAKAQAASTKAQAATAGAEKAGRAEAGADKAPEPVRAGKAKKRKKTA